MRFNSGFKGLIKIIWGWNLLILIKCSPEINSIWAANLNCRFLKPRQGQSNVHLCYTKCNSCNHSWWDITRMCHWNSVIENSWAWQQDVTTHIYHHTLKYILYGMCVSYIINLLIRDKLHQESIDHICLKKCPIVYILLALCVPAASDQNTCCVFSSYRP